MVQGGVPAALMFVVDTCHYVSMIVHNRAISRDIMCDVKERRQPFWCTAAITIFIEDS